MASPALSFSLDVGQRVRVKTGDPPGHIRTPEYLRGREGVIERRQGAFRNPEEVAFGGQGLPKQPLYLVRRTHYSISTRPGCGPRESVNFIP